MTECCVKVCRIYAGRESDLIDRDSKLPHKPVLFSVHACERMYCILIRQRTDCCFIKLAGQHELERSAGLRNIFLLIFWCLAPKLSRLIAVHRTTLKLCYGAKYFFVCCFDLLML